MCPLQVCNIRPGLNGKRGGKERRVPFRVHLRNTWACVERKEWEEVQSPRLLKGEPARSDGLTSSDFLLTSF